MSMECCRDERSPLLPISASSSRLLDSASASASARNSNKAANSESVSCDDTSGCTDSVSASDDSVWSARQNGIANSCALALLAVISTVLFSLLFVALPAPAPGAASARQFAYVDLMRHGEKDDASGERLSALGRERADYYARCLDPARPASPAAPAPVEALFAQRNATVTPRYKGNDGLSQRAYQTLEPLSRATGLSIHNPCKMTDLDCVVAEVEDLLRVNSTLLVTWEHKLIPQLLRELGVPRDSGAPPGGWPKWPEACDAASWKNPRLRQPQPTGREKLWRGAPFPFHNACFDLVWQVKFVRGGEDGAKWEAVGARTLQNGFGGSADSPCAEGLAPGLDSAEKKTISG